MKFNYTLPMKKRLRVLRAEQEPKLSQARAAVLARMSQARFWQIENGVGLPPTSDEKDAIAAALGAAAGQIDWPDIPKAKAS